MGSSNGQFFKQYREPIKLNDVHIDWKAMDLSYLMEDKFLKHFAKLVADAKPVEGTDDKKTCSVSRMSCLMMIIIPGCHSRHCSLVARRQYTGFFSIGRGIVQTFRDEIFR